MLKILRTVDKKLDNKYEKKHDKTLVLPFCLTPKSICSVYILTTYRDQSFDYLKTNTQV